jgi:dienelactone hydrolase
MPYVEKGLRRRSAEEQEQYMQWERGNLNAARDWLAEHASIDPKRLFLGGISKGGWMTSRLGELEMDGLAGLVIILAGRQRGATREPEQAALRGKPIYVGVGESDPNRKSALWARVFYRANGAVVTYEEYAGLGHRMANEPVQLIAWLEAQGRFRHADLPDDALAALKQTFHDLYTEVMAEQEAARKYARLRALAEDPRLLLCGDRVAEGVRGQLALAAQQPAVRDEWLAEQAFDRLVWKDLTVRRLRDLEAVRDGFRALGTTYAHTRYGKLAAVCAEHAAASYEKSRAATDKLKKLAPGDPIHVDFGATTDPRRKGPKITTR